MERNGNSNSEEGRGSANRVQVGIRESNISGCLPPGHMSMLAMTPLAGYSNRLGYNASGIVQFAEGISKSWVERENEDEGQMLVEGEGRE